MVGWHPRLNGNEFEQTPWDSEGQGSLGCCKSMGLDRMEQLNNNRSGSEDLRKLNPLYKFMQFIHDAGIGTLVCAFKHNKIILSHWRKLNSSKFKINGLASRYPASSGAINEGLDWESIHTKPLQTFSDNLPLWNDHQSDFMCPVSPRAQRTLNLCILPIMDAEHIFVKGINEWLNATVCLLRAYNLLEMIRLVHTHTHTQV